MRLRFAPIASSEQDGWEVPEETELQQSIDHPASPTIDRYTTRGGALDAVREDGKALRWVSAALKNDHEIVMEAVKQDKEAMRYASPILTKDLIQGKFSKKPGILTANITR